jgi:hypothetical protein
MKRLRFLTLTIFVILLLFPPLSASAQCPDGDPDCPAAPPQSVEVDLGTGTSDEGRGAASVTGALAPLQVPAPSFVAPEPLRSPAVGEPTFNSLDLRLRYQGPDDVSCGVQALGMALEGLGGSPPSSAALTDFLHGQGMMYAFGTGVEELAHAAQSFGYKGALPFHGGSLEQLRSELAAGRPVVVSLGVNGEDQPGHFVTVTGISPDGNWVSYNDPTLGKRVVSSETFLRQWKAQGMSGVVVRREAPGGGEMDYASWVAMAAGAMALVSTSPLARKRKGIGGRLTAQVGTGGVSGSSPPYRAPTGYRWRKKQVPEYGWKREQVVKNRQVPNMVQQRVRVGTRVVYEDVPIYKSMRVDEGHWAYRRVTRYRSERYVRYYRRERVESPYWYQRGGRWVRGMHVEWRRKPVYGYRRVPYTASERYWQPKWVSKRVLEGYREVRREKPIYDWIRVPDGTTRTERYTTTERRWGQVGTKVKWELERDPHTTPSPPTPTPAPLPIPRPDPRLTPEIVATPRPGVRNEPPELEGKWAARGLRLVKSARSALTAREVMYRALESGYISVSAPTRAIGTRREFLSGYGFLGTRYKPSTITSISGRHLIAGALSKASWITAGVTSAIGNVIDYGLGKNKDKGIASQEFVVSTGVDTVMAVGTGVVSAAAVAVGGAVLTAATPIVVTTTAAIVATAGIGFLLGLALDHFGVSEKAKKVVNHGVDVMQEEATKLKNEVVQGLNAWGGIADNAKVIGQAAVKRTSDVFQNTAQAIQGEITDTFQTFKGSLDQAVESVGNKLSDTVNIAESFIGKIMSGG